MEVLSVPTYYWAVIMLAASRFLRDDLQRETHSESVREGEANRSRDTQRPRSAYGYVGRVGTSTIVVYMQEFRGL